MRSNKSYKAPVYLCIVVPFKNLAKNTLSSVSLNICVFAKFMELYSNFKKQITATHRENKQNN